MGTREEYTACMKPHMTGGGPDRKERFCVGAKLCSGKAKTKEEATRLCAEAAANPKPAAVGGKKSRKCKIVAPDMAACIIENLGESEVSLVNLTTAVSKCTGQKVAKPLSPTTQKNFMKKCFKENPVRDMREANKIRLLCMGQWKDKEGKAS